MIPYPLILSECESRVAGVRSLLTIGQRQANGVRWGFATDKPLDQLAAFVCDAHPETNTHGENPVGYWARYWRRLIEAQQAMYNGHAYLDMSGWFGAACKANDAARIYYVDAAREAVEGITFSADSAVWWNTEGLDQITAGWFARYVWDSGVFGPARLIATGCSAPPRGIDGRTCLVEAQLPDGDIDDAIGAATLSRVQRDYHAARAAGLYVVAHVDHPDYDAQGRPATADRVKWNLKIIDELADANAWLAFNPAGRLNMPNKGDAADEVVQLNADAGLVLAVCGKREAEVPIA